MKKRILAMLLAVVMVTALLPFGASAEGKKLIALTFDDGPSQYTESLLDGLKERGARVSFFMQGMYAQDYPEIVRRAWEDGHQICSHAYNHPNLTKLTEDEVRYQLGHTDEILDAALGFDARYMIRPPYGNANETVLQIGGVPFFYWSLSVEDWNDHDPDSLCQQLVDKVQNGSIILLHDLYPASIEAALRAIDTLQEQGYEFVTVAELFFRNGARLQNAAMYYSCYPNPDGPAPALADPVISLTPDPNGGMTVTITGDSRGEVYYSLDGELPTPVNTVRYAGAFTLESACTIRAVTVADWNSVRSNETSAEVGAVPPAAPKLSMDGGTMTMTSETPDAVIRYTIDNTAPTAESAVYTGPVAVPRGSTVRAIALTEDGCASAVTRLTFTANGNIMSDVDVGAWYYPHLDRAVSEGIISGTAPTVMSPNAPLTRAMLVTMLYRMAKPEGKFKRVSFIDVTKGTWYYDALCWANAKGIARGYPNNTFRPDVSITRAELAAMLARYLRAQGRDVPSDLSVLKQFADGDRITEWARGDIAAMISLGVIRGYEDNTIGSANGATRAEAVTMLLRTEPPAPTDEPAPIDEPIPTDAPEAPEP